jgi:hypothetical protein
MLMYTTLAFSVALIMLALLSSGAKVCSVIYDRGFLEISSACIFFISAFLFAFVVPLYLLTALK